MIQQLILNTLMACHSKSEGVVSSSVNVQPEPEVQTDSSSAPSDDSTSSSAEVVSTESVPTVGTPDTPSETKNPEKEKAEKKTTEPQRETVEKFPYTEEELAFISGLQPYQKPPWPSSLPEPVGLDTLPEMFLSSAALEQYSSTILLSDLSYYDLRFYDQPQDNPYEYVCKQLCNYSSNEPNGDIVRLTTVRHCQMDLIENWKEVVGAVQEQGREELLPQLEVKVGVVSCTGSTGLIKHGRAATTPVQYEALDDDWGGYFARLAQEEATAVFAFGELLEHLQDWEAPSSLQDWCGRIIEEEKVHTLMMSGLAHRNGQQSAVVQFPEPNIVSMKEMAIHNALTGCIGETWSAVLLRYQSEHAPKYNGVFKRIAKDETSHAEFSWVLHEWLMSHLTESEREDVIQAMREMLSTLPKYRCTQQIGEMSTEVLGQAWESFSEEVRTILAA